MSTPWHADRYRGFRIPFQAGCAAISASSAGGSLFRSVCCAADRSFDVVPSNNSLFTPGPEQQVRMLRQMLPQVFDLSRVSEIFSAFLTVLQQEGGISSMSQVDSDVTTVLYKFGQLSYLATITRSTTVSVAKTGIAKHVSIRLPNGAFLYSPPDELAGQQLEDWRQQCPGWYRLDTSAHAAFQPMINHARKFIGDESAKAIIFYNFTMRRIDLKVHSSLASSKDRSMLSICFEPGYPEYDFKDDW